MTELDNMGYRVHINPNSRRVTFTRTHEDGSIMGLRLEGMDELRRFEIVLARAKRNLDELERREPLTDSLRLRSKD